MGDERFERWASGFLGVVSLALILNLARTLGPEARRDFWPGSAPYPSPPIKNVARLSPLGPKLNADARPAKAAGIARDSSVPSAGGSETLLKKSRAKHQRDSAASGAVGDVASSRVNPPGDRSSLEPSRTQEPPGPEAAASASTRPALDAADPAMAPAAEPMTAAPAGGAAAIAPAQPTALSGAALQTGNSSAAPTLLLSGKIIEMQAMGYIERADGTRQAAVTEGDRVFLVHEGETFDDHYRVVSISRSTVQVADLAVPSVAPETPAGTMLAMSSSRGAQVSAAVARATRPGAKARADSRRRAQLADAARPIATAIIARASAKAPGRGSASAEKAVNGGSHEAGEPAEMSKPRAAQLVSLASRESSKLEHDKLSDFSMASGAATQVPQTISSQSFQSLGYVKRPGHPQETIVSQGDRIKLVPDQTAAAENLQAATSRPEAAGSPAMGAAEHTAGSSAGSLQKVSYWVRNAGSDDPAIRHFKAYCFVEKEDGTREAFITLDDQAYLVYEGEVFANRFRVLKITPISVEADDEWAEENKSPPHPPPEVARSDPSSRAIAELPLPTIREALLWGDTAASWGSVSANPSLIGENTVFQDSRSSPPVQSEPTLARNGSSTLGVPVGPSNDFAGGLPESLFPEPGSARHSDEFAGSRAISDPASLINRPEATIARTVRLRGHAGITPLPLEMDRPASLLAMPSTEGISQPPVNPGAAAFVPPGAEAPRPSGIGHGGQATPVATSAEVFSGPGGPPTTGFQTLSGGDLQLHFSIGDNGCYFPR